eukprot:930446-Pelagomonas_calceolata.AAC.4
MKLSITHLWDGALGEQRNTSISLDITLHVRDKAGELCTHALLKLAVEIRKLHARCEPQSELNKLCPPVHTYPASIDA